jgi:starch phosphorylase
VGRWGSNLPDPEVPSAFVTFTLPEVGRDLSDPDVFAREFIEELRFGQGVDLARATPNDCYMALARTVRQALMARWIATLDRQLTTKARFVCYLSAEYLLGRQLDNALLAADLESTARQALAGLGLDLDVLRAAEVEPGLGNGGLGRLAACFMDSLATLKIPAAGYGIRYEYGIFRQEFQAGRQKETPDTWLAHGNPWEFAHPEMAKTVGFGGHVETWTDEQGRHRRRWLPATEVLGVPYNYMVPGYGNGTVNTLRLWSARAPHGFDLRIFNTGDYEAAVRAQSEAENISKVLYPEDSTPQGRRLRLQQQYFFVACSIRDFFDLLPEDTPMARLPDRVVFQLNDTHPVIAIPEMLRILMDEQGLDFAPAWEITQRCFAYTCHTLLPEALEVWPVGLMESLLPRHMELIYQINDWFLTQLRAAYPGDEVRVRRMSIIAEHPERSVRMAYLASVAGYRVNGVAELHSQLLREKVLADFAEFFPDKFTNVTNGVTPRRFVRLANPALSALITEHLGDGWLTDLEQLRGLEPLADDAEFRSAFAAVKWANKQRAVQVLAARDGIEVSADSLFDVMVKRLHEYKRQTLKLLHVVSLHQRIRSGELDPATIVPRTVVFGAKAAPGYRIAKEIIALINAVGASVNADPLVAGRLRVAFPANYNVTLAETLIPAADLSEQISLAGKEASGTGNMKFALNGALTVGTLDGANVEILQLVGADNFFLFGLDEQQASDTIARGYSPSAYYESDPRLRQALGAVAAGAYSGGDPSTFAQVVDQLLTVDPFLVLADFGSYLDAQARIEEAYRDPHAWTRSAILNVARTGWFSSDRSIRDYLDRIWHAWPVPPATA